MEEGLREGINSPPPNFGESGESGEARTSPETPIAKSVGHVTADSFRLCAIAETIQSLGMQAMAIRMGDVTIHLAEAWPPKPKAEFPKLPKNKPPGIDSIENEDGTLDELGPLRDLAKRLMGYVPPDDMLRAIAPALKGK